MWLVIFAFCTCMHSLECNDLESFFYSKEIQFICYSRIEFFILLLLNYSKIIYLFWIILVQRCTFPWCSKKSLLIKFGLNFVDIKGVKINLKVASSGIYFVKYLWKSLKIQFFCKSMKFNVMCTILLKKKPFVQTIYFFKTVWYFLLKSI